MLRILKIVWCFFIHFLFSYITWWTIHQLNIIQKTKKVQKASNRYQNLSEEQKEKSSTMFVINIKTSLNLINRGWLTREKTITYHGKMLCNKTFVKKVLGWSFVLVNTPKIRFLYFQHWCKIFILFNSSHKD